MTLITLIKIVALISLTVWTLAAYHIWQLSRHTDYLLNVSYYEYLQSQRTLPANQ